MSFVAGAGSINIDLLFEGLPRIPNEGEELYSRGFSLQMGGGVSATLLNLAGLGVPVRIQTGSEMICSPTLPAALSPPLASSLITWQTAPRASRSISQRPADPIRPDIRLLHRRPADGRRAHL